MAKKAKKELTPEERLEAALVPVEEQPYEVPGSWCWTKVGFICSFVGGGTPSKDNPEYWDGDIPWASVKDIKGDYLFETIDHITEEGYQNSAANICNEGDLLLVTRIEPAKTIIASIQTAINQDLKIVKSSLSSSFLHFFFIAFQHEFEAKSSGSTVKGITIPNIENSLFPLPPLLEQQRIVDRIESLFAKLDEAKEAVQAVVDGFEDRKAAILHKAFTGELTAEWRKKNQIDSDSWKAVCLKDIVTGFKYGSSEKSDYNNQGLPVLRIPNIGDGVIDFSDLKYFTDARTDSAYYVHEDEILIIRSNGSRDLVGKCALVPKLDREYAYASFLIKILPSNSVRAEYLVMYLNSADARKQMFARAKSSAGIHNINSKELGAISLSIPTLKEQETIVVCLRNILNTEFEAVEAAGIVLDQIGTMKKSILARAFRGELGTNDPNDEPAVELLKRILA